MRATDGAATGLAFGGSDFSTLYAASRTRIFQRRMKVNGVPSFVTAVVTPPNR